MQIKEWKFDKNISRNQTDLLAARARDGDNETTLGSKGKEVRSGKLSNFKKRKIAEKIVPAPQGTGMRPFPSIGYSKLT